MSESESQTKITELAVKDIASFMSAIVHVSRQFNNTRAWWRGQRDASWKLMPSLYRLGFEEKEVNLNGRFRLMAKARKGEVPSNTDPLAWLFLMQHYRLPTRLLDWSQSPLVALYFAIEKPDDSDAAMWALSPTDLNNLEAQIPSICMPGSDIIGQLGVQAFRPPSEKRDSRIISVLTEEADPRQMVQQSAFTLHGRGNPLDQRDEANKFLVKVRIPAKAKAGLREAIALLGISRASLFPDLENLALEIASLNYQTKSIVEELVDESKGNS